MGERGQVGQVISIYPTGAGKTARKASNFFGILKELTGLDIVPFSSARAALVYGLRAMGVGRMDEILVPPYLSHCITSALGKTAFPTMTPSERTKAILVFHQFGYPQKMDYIEGVALKNGWFIINDCANTILSEFRGKSVLCWGDFGVLSFPKLYHCNLGGGLIVRHGDLQERIDDNYVKLTAEHAERASMLYEALLGAKRNDSAVEQQFEIDAIYGYLPEVVPCPSQVLSSLPDTALEIRRDADRRKRLLDIVNARFPDRVPDITGDNVVPFAIPIGGKPSCLEEASLKIEERLGIEAPVLHFDFARNMLAADYRKALIIGCHSDWNEKCVEEICQICEETFC